MDQGTEPIRQDIDQIRASMTDKMERIEAKIKDSVDETTGSVKRMIDVKYQVSEHPWTALGISVLAGIALGSLGDTDSSPDHANGRNGTMNTTEAYERARSTAAYPSNYGTSSGYGQGSYDASSYTSPGAASGYDRPHAQESQFNGSASYNQGSHTSNAFAPAGTGNAWATHGAAGMAGNSWSQSQPAKPNVMDQISRQFGGEIETLKAAAVSSLVSMVRDTIRQNFPSMHHEMERMRRDPSTPSDPTNWSSGGSSAGFGSTSNTDYAASAVNNPSHVTGMSDPARSTSGYDAKNSNPDDLRRDSSTL